jgi:nitrate reductase assembly molybdenum cofactor insertion protein NarJ
MTTRASLTERSRSFLLASIAIGYPDGELAPSCAALASVPDGVRPILAALARSLEDLQSAYIDRFDRGKHRVSLYETEYGRMRGLSKGNDLADLCGFYRAFGLTLEDEQVHEMPDHLAVELEFYAVLLLKQELLGDRRDEEGRAIVERARGSFLVDHLGRVARAIAARPELREDPIYGPLLAWCAELVDAECAELGVTPAPLDFFANDGERDSPECGGVRLPVIQ